MMDPTMNALLAPFRAEEVETCPGGGGRYAYIDARCVRRRLNEVLGPSAWSFMWTPLPDSPAVKGTLSIQWEGSATSIYEDVGYPNGEGDKEPLKSAVSDALKRCAVSVGIGALLYEMARVGDRVTDAQIRQAAIAAGWKPDAPAANPADAFKDRIRTTLATHEKPPLAVPEAQPMSAWEAAKRDLLRTAHQAGLPLEGSNGRAWILRICTVALGRLASRPTDIKDLEGGELARVADWITAHHGFAHRLVSEDDFDAIYAEHWPDGSPEPSALPLEVAEVAGHAR